MTQASSIDRETFLDHLRRSGLVPERDLASLASLQPEQTRGKQLARLLVDRGTITRYQAERLLAGRTDGFALGPYRILDLLGQGGMGRVYKAEHRTMQRVVALKVLANTVLQTERAVQLFLHEARAVGVLQHPNIVVAYDANEVNGQYYLVLEYVDGPNLEQLVRRQGPLAVGLACHYVRQAALGLQFAHELGMCHRDIKPANLLLQTRAGTGHAGVVKVSDFGLARLALQGRDETDRGSVTILTRDNTVMGTPDYLSPEQSRCLHQADIRSDLYSLGCSFHYLLTGEVPFPGGNGVEKLIRHATEEPRPISSFRGDVPPPVAAVVRLLMAKRPEDRFADPAEVAYALEPFAINGPPGEWSRPAAPSGELVALDRSTDELAALAGTDSNPRDDTATGASPSRIVVRPRPREERPIGLAVSIAIGIAFGLIGFLFLLAKLSGGK